MLYIVVEQKGGPSSWRIPNSKYEFYDVGWILSCAVLVFKALKSTKHGQVVLKLAIFDNLLSMTNKTEIS